jgi:hypothetical protein
MIVSDSEHPDAKVVASLAGAAVLLAAFVVVEAAWARCSRRCLWSS